jgi:glyoxylase-like metal-dependent hydrolase (beta-lactamase superfamily II)
MNKILKRILIGVGILVGLVSLVVVGFLLKFNSETKKMHAIETGLIVDNIYAVKNDFVNMFLIKDSTNYIAIDAGKDLDVVEAELKKLNIDPKKVTTVLLTHTDPDHAAGLPLFTNAKVYLSKYEVDMLTGEQQKIPGVSNSISVKDYNLLENNETKTFANIKVFNILTEGHTTGSLCYLINDKYLFTGDILSLKNGKIDISVKFLDLDHDLATKSISKITKLPTATHIFTAHFGYSDNYTEAVKDWKE